MSLIAYFDESGTHSGGPNAAKVFVVAGYIAPEEVWRDAFAPKWKKMLQSFELPDQPNPPYFHATELESGKFPYNRLSDTARDELKMAAVNIAVNCGLIGVGGGVVNADYKRIMAPYIKRGLVHKTPYVFLFSDVVVECIQVSYMFVGQDPSSTISFVFEDHPRWSIEAHRMFVMMQNDLAWPNRVRLGTVAFEDKRKHYPLQVADHLAFETFHYMEHAGPNRPAMNRFVSWRQNHGRYYNEAALRSFIDVCKQDGKF